MSAQVKPIPDNLHAITPNLVCRDAAAAIEFYKSAFGAIEIARAGPRRKNHACRFENCRFDDFSE